MGKDQAVPFLLEQRMRELGGAFVAGPDWHPHAGGWVGGWVGRTGGRVGWQRAGHPGEAAYGPLWRACLPALQCLTAS